MVFPTPFTPTTRITYGVSDDGISKPWFSSLTSLPSVARSCVISSLRITLSSLVLTYLSRATRSSMRWMISKVVSTPTSLVMRMSSRLSSTSSSTFDFPATAWAIFENTLVLVFWRPLSSVSFFSFFEKKLKNPISIEFVQKYDKILKWRVLNLWKLQAIQGLLCRKGA